MYRRWQSPSPDAVFLLVHGLGAHSGRWERFAAYFLEHSISSYAIDLRGFGQAPGAKGHVDSFRSYFEDILALRDIIGRECGGKPVFLIGESMGGLISFWLARRQPGAFAGLVCLSPAFKSRLAFGPGELARIYRLCLTDPKRPVKVPFTSAMCTRDSECARGMDADPLEHRLATPWLLLQIALSGLRLRFCPGSLNVPVLFQVAGDRDVFVDPAAAKKVLARLKARGKELIEYPEMFHALSVDIGRERVFGDILQWLRPRIKGGLT